MLFYDSDCEASLYGLAVLAQLKHQFRGRATFYSYNLKEDDLPEDIEVARVPALQLWRGGKGQALGGLLTKRGAGGWLAALL